MAYSASSLTMNECPTTSNAPNGRHIRDAEKMMTRLDDNAR